MVEILSYLERHRFSKLVWLCLRLLGFHLGLCLLFPLQSVKDDPGDLPLLRLGLCVCPSLEIFSQDLETLLDGCKLVRNFGMALIAGFAALSVDPDGAVAMRPHF